MLFRKVFCSFENAKTGSVPLELRFLGGGGALAWYRHLLRRASGSFGAALVLGDTNPPISRFVATDLCC